MDPRDPSRQGSIFNNPDDDDDLRAPTRANDRADSQPPAAPQPPVWRTDRAELPASSSGPSRTVLALGVGGGVLILLIAGYVAGAVLRPSEGVAGASQTATATESVRATPTAEPSATPAPSPTPSPTPTGPPQKVAQDGWATVVVDELNIHSGPGTGAASGNVLVNGAVVHVAEGPQAVDGQNWYRVTSLGGTTGWAASGWKEDPFLKTVASDPTLAECGHVRRAVFDTRTGAVIPNDVLRIGAFAVPSAAFSEPSLAAIELFRGMGQEVCFSARIGPDGFPDLSADLGIQACGHAAADGSIFRLEPTDDDSVALASQVIEPTIVDPAVFTGLPADDRMSTNLLTILAMMTNDGTSGCLNLNVTQRADSTEWYRQLSASQCSRVSLYNEHSIKFSPASGGREAWIKLNAENYQRGLFPLERKVTVSVDASVDDNERQYAYAHPYGEDACD